MGGSSTCCCRGTHKGCAIFRNRHRIGIALAIEGIAQGTSYGTPAFKTRNKLLARLREDNESFVVATTFEERAELMAAEPDTCFITDHYLNSPLVLVSLPHVHPDALRDLLKRATRLAAMAGGRVAPKVAGKPDSRRAQ